ncbi:outer membrane protein assembly factor BamA [Mariniflexile fucanivorans]|uniref:Outer membrane protein assembly factor BamA n=1 Tax=Mariniflexile fucanivorans TaxID=264023 RepID=A0A4R1RMV3_9FLAO|nr:BamA/TamA family outer membrane protein [Mariniflexile fucanivorans]TCL67618.1 outer membrane protein assembly factor BamA [Mariniflexile fucanivorans]
MKINNYIALLFSVAFLLGCSGTRKIPEGNLLYVGHTLKIEKGKEPKKTRKAIESALNELIRPEPNKSFLGMRPSLFFYNIFDTVNKDKGFKHWVKYKLGKAPVLMSKVDLEYNKKVIQNYVENKGFFNAESSADSTRTGKKAKANYEVNLHNQYKIKSVVFPKDSILLANEIDTLKENSLLKIGKPYDLDVIKSERTRIDTKLKERGFYYFNEDYLLVQVDSTVANHEVDLLVKIKNDIPEKAKNQYRINNIFVYPSFNLKRDTISTRKMETTKYEDLTIIDNKTVFKPFIFDKTLLFNKGDLYNRTTHNLSLNRLITLGTFKFVKNEFKENDSLENNLDAYYYLTPLQKKSIQVEALAKTNSANYSGTELNVNWSNRNTFKGAELLKISAFAGLEAQVSGQNNGFNVYRFGGEANLIWPRFISPFTMSSGSAYVPNTKASLSYEYQLRTKLYSLKTFNGSFGYLWKENERKEHNLNVVNIAYTSSNNVSDLYKSQIAENPSLQKVIDKQFILGTTYSYTYTNTMLKNKKNNIYFKGEVDLSGNSVGLILGANDSDNPKSILGVPFSQYSKLEMDFRHYYNFNKQTTLASRIIVGAGIPYGNSEELPFIKQFFIGGTSSIRAFRARSIGPGTFNGNEVTNSFLPDQSGDLKLELNTELRTTLYKFVKGALFVDAGNIWLLNESAEKPGAKFSGQFLNELAVGAGVGLRFDFSFLVLRTDFAFPLRKPYLQEGNRWVIDDISFGNSGWRKENLIFNLAIGYPF